jgi:ParB family chromosome partitioning protein
MEIIEIPIAKIKPDLNQPRKTFSKDKIAELAMTFKTVGIINPIELDKSYTIITGENRWRAAMVAGLKTVPAKVMDISDEDRFLRQVIENIQYANLTPIEIARALEKLLTTLAGRLVRDKKHQNPRYQKGHKELAELLGKNIDFVTMYLDLLKQSEPLQQAVEKGLPVTHLRSLHDIPPEYKKTFEKKLLSGEFKTRDASRYVADAIKRNPEKTQEILAVDYSKYKTSQEAGVVARKFSPDYADFVKASMTAPKQLNQLAVALRDWCKANPVATIGSMYQFQIGVTMAAMREDIDNWLKGNKLIKGTERSQSASQKE